MRIIAILTIVAIVLIAVFYESKRRDQLAAVLKSVLALLTHVRLPGVPKVQVGLLLLLVH